MWSASTCDGLLIFSVKTLFISVIQSVNTGIVVCLRLSYHSSLQINARLARTCVDSARSAFMWCQWPSSGPVAVKKGFSEFFDAKHHANDPN